MGALRIATSNSVWIGIIILVIVTFAPGIWFLMHYKSYKVLQIGSYSLSVSYQTNPLMFYAGVFLISFGIISILWAGYIYNNIKNNLIEYFSICPICKSPNVLAKISFSMTIDDVQTVACQNCGAKWKIKTSGATGNIKTVKLVKPSDDGRGQEYLSKETDPEFWASLAREKE